MNNIALVFRTGGDYTPEYVKRLADSLTPYGTVICLTDYDGPLPCVKWPLLTSWPGWWAKLELFERFRYGRTVYFDLDTVIDGDISALFELDAPFYMLRDFYYPERFGSGVMVWNGDHSYVTDDFTPERMGRYSTPRRWGDQGWLTDHVDTPIARLQDECPGLIASYKASTRQEKTDAAIVCYHGQPRPIQTGWAKV